MRVRHAGFLVIAVLLIILSTLTSRAADPLQPNCPAPDNDCDAAIGENHNNCPVDCKGVTNDPCTTSSMCQSGICCGGTCQATACTAGFTNTACGDPGQYLYQSCSGSCPGTTTCKYDCDRTTCNTPTECKITSGSYCTASGCVYPTPAPKGDACSSTTKVCDGQGSCSLPKCAAPSFCSSSTSLTGVTANGNWCAGTNEKCYTCTIGRWDGTTCVQNLCASGNQPYCDGSTLQTCQPINGVYRWVGATCPSTCTTTPTPAHCCTPDPTKCTYTTTCSKTGTDNCGTPNSPICNRVTAGNTCNLPLDPTPRVCDANGVCAGNCGGICKSTNTVTPPTESNYDPGGYCPSGYCINCAYGYIPYNNVCVTSCKINGNDCGPTVPPGATHIRTQYCEKDPYCFSCPPGTRYDTGTKTCEASQCTSCALGTTRCNAGALETCTGTATCPVWTGQACPVGQTCTTTSPTSAQCTSCVPTCTTSGLMRCASNAPQVCDSTNGCLQWRTTTSCSQTQLCVESSGTAACTSYHLQVHDADQAGWPVITEKRVANGMNFNVYLDLDAALPAGVSADFSGSGYKPFSQAGGYTPLPISGTIGQTVYEDFTAKVNGVVIATYPKFPIIITCASTDACYCKASCITGDQTGVTPSQGYCESGTCGTCPATKVFNGTSCVECAANDLSKCADPAGASPSCFAKSCVNSACKIAFSTGASCGTNLYCSSAGICVGCTADSQCTPTASTEYQITTTGDGCTYTNQTLKVTTTQVCSNSACVPAATTKAKDGEPRIGTYENGHTCPTGLCFQGACQPAYCAQAQGPSPTEAVSSIINWKGNYSACNGVVTMCNITIEHPYSSFFVDYSCTTATGAGLCKGQDSCVLQCPTLTNPDKPIPGCRDFAGDHMVPTAQACPGTQRCYECAPKHFLKDGACVAMSSEYTFDFSTSSTAAKSDITITPQLTYHGSTVSNDNHEYVFMMTTASTSKESFGTFTIRVNDPGDYPITVAVMDAESGNTIGSVSKTLAITCPLSNACCPANSNTYLRDGSSCTQNGEQGICRSKTCITGCTPSGPEVCNNGKDDDCNGRTDCGDDTCSATCGGIVCKPGELLCERTCTAVQTDHMNCGQCGVRCDSDEQCIEGACTPVEGCDVICNIDAECGRGMICINPGSCTNSYCAPANVLTTNSSKAVDVMGQYTKTFTITKEIRDSQLHITINNLAPVPLQGFTLTVALPKTVAQSASDLGASDPFTVIQEDPVIAFSIQQVNAKKEVTIDLPEAVDPAFVSSVSVSGTHDPLNGTPAVLTDEVTITSNVVKDNGKTKLLLGINPHAELYGVRVPVEIPKCVALSAEQLELSGDYEIVRDDPLVVWTFDALTSKETIEIGVDGDVEENCKDQLTAFAVADLVDKPLNPWIPLLLIPIIGIVLVTFSRFHSVGSQERLSEEEFKRLAMEQGQTKEQVEQSWREYERKF